MTNDVIMINNKNLSREINSEIKEGLNNGITKFHISSDEQLDFIGVGIQKDSEILLEGDFGDFIGALNDGAKIGVDGNCQRYVGNNMTRGEIVVKGSASDGVGFGLSEGTIVIRGNAGDAIGQLNKGGSIIINGDIGDSSGLFMLSGDIIVTGNAGIETGEWMVGGNIYIGGECTLGNNTKFVDLDENDISKLENLFSTYGINANISNFKKIVHIKIRPFYGEDE